MGKIVSKALRDSARGEVCTVQIYGICNYDPETTVLAHLPDESKGMGTKSDDISGCYACASCHDALDGRRKEPIAQQELEWYMRRAQTRTLRRLFEKGILSINGAA